MKILFANNYYYNRGGSEKVFFDEMNLLKENGFNVDAFSVNDTKSIEIFGFNNNFSNESEIKFIKIFNKLKNLFYNKDAKQKIEQLILKNKYDILHMHNIYSRLSPSIVKVAKKHKLKMVLTLHDYKFICPHMTLMYNGEICEVCKGGNFYNAILNKCHKNSYIASGLVALEAYNFDRINLFKNIDTFIAPSYFLLNKFKSMGFKGNIVYIPNFIDIPQIKKTVNLKNTKKNYYLFIGRLSFEKGIHNLLEAFKKNNKKLIIVGTGPMEEEIKKFIKTNGLSSRISLTGFMSSDKVFDYIIEAKAIIVPSIWYENAPISILESLYYGKPVLASDIGGISEMVIDEKNGFLFDYKDYNTINEAITKLESLSEKDIIKFKDYSHNLINDVFSKKNHINKLKKLYNSLLEKEK